MSNCKHFPDADDHCVICARGQIELHLLTINLPGDEVEFPAGEHKMFPDADGLREYVDNHHPQWTSLVVVVLPPKLV